MSLFFMVYVMLLVCMSGICGAIVLSVAHVTPTGFGGRGGGSVSSGFVSLPLTFSLTSMAFSSCIVGMGSGAAGNLASGLANAFGTAHAKMKGAGNMHPLSIPSILRLGTGPSACRVHTVMLAS